MNRIIDLNNGTSKIYGNCRVTKKPYSVIVPNDGLAEYMNGALVQRAFPDLSVDDREFLISGTTPEGWALTFPEEFE